MGVNFYPGEQRGVFRISAIAAKELPVKVNTRGRMYIHSLMKLILLGGGEDEDEGEGGNEKREKRRSARPPRRTPVFPVTLTPDIPSRRSVIGLWARDSAAFTSLTTRQGPSCQSPGVLIHYHLLHTRYELTLLYIYICIYICTGCP